MSVFISYKDTAKLYVQFCRPKKPQNISSRMSWSIIMKDFEAIQKTLSHVLSGIHFFFKQYFSNRLVMPLLGLTAVVNNTAL